MRARLEYSFVPFFFGLCACSWMPHWACHYYRLETGTSFVVGSWNFSVLDSALSLVVYSTLVVLSLMSISVVTLRLTVALTSGFLHLLIGSLHVFRLQNPFPFEVFGSAWSQGASMREVLIVIPFGFLCLFVALRPCFRKS